MKALLLALAFVCVACGKETTGTSKTAVSEEPFNYQCYLDPVLNENGYNVYMCLEIETENVCNVVYKLNQFFESDCEDITKDLFQDYLKTRGN